MQASCGLQPGGLLLLLLLALAAACMPNAASARPASRELLLVGGKRASGDTRYTYLARIHFVLDDERGLLAGCGGTLISRSVILTAAHCTALAKPRGKPKNVYVRIGAFNPLTDEAMRNKDEYALRRAAKVVTHPDYIELGEDQPTSPHDLALILLDEPVPERFPIVQLPTADTPYPADGTELHALGWGSTDSDNSQPAYFLQDLELPAVGIELCSQQWGYAGAPTDLLENGHICAGLKAQRNICFGDSGGPLLLRGNKAADDVQLGVISFSFPTCALPGMPGVFTFLPRYRKWIDQQLAKLDPKSMPSESEPASAKTAAEPRDKERQAAAVAARPDEEQPEGSKAAEQVPVPAKLEQEQPVPSPEAAAPPAAEQTALAPAPAPQEAAVPASPVVQQQPLPEAELAAPAATPAELPAAELAAPSEQAAPAPAPSPVL